MIQVVCDNHAGKVAKFATFERGQDGWAVMGRPDSRRPSKPGRPLRVVHILGSGVVNLPPLRCKRCGKSLPPSIDTKKLNNLVQQRVSQVSVQQLNLIASQQR